MDDRIIVNCILKNGKKELFSLIVKNYGGIIFSRSLGITRNAELAKEATQQAFIRAYTRLSSWNGKELGPWLATIAAHEALNLMEKEKRNAQIPKRMSDQAAKPPNEEYSEERERLLQRMEAALDELPPQDQQVIRLHYYDKVKTEDIARRLGLSHSNVLVKLHRIRERLRKRLQDDND